MLFGWRRRNEGFEWREHVRTTILVRRADRQKRLDDARMAAIEHVKDVRDRGIDAGKRKAGIVREGAAAGMRRARSAVAAAARGVLELLARGVRQFANAFAGAVKAAPRPAMPRIAGRVGADIAMYGADIPRRWRLLKPYLGPAAGALAVVFVFGAALAPRDLAGKAGSPEDRLVIAAAGISAEPASLQDAQSDRVVYGRARAVSGDLLRVGGTLVKLAGIDAPQPAQPCLKSNGRRWNCAAAATSALRRLVRGKRVSCELSAAAVTGAPAVAHCRAADLDLAAELVGKGYVFAATAGSVDYASNEEQAREAKIGIWRGDVERPEAWRAKIWDEAKRTAPDGCPIKGLVSAKERVYAMPWSQGYTERSIRMAKGERWFCSEDEAQAAGFRLSSQL